MARRDLEKLRRDKEHRLEDLRRLEAENVATKKDQPDLKIEELERQLRAAEAARKDAQTRLEFAHTQWRDNLLQLQLEVEESAGKGHSEQQRRL